MDPLSHITNTCPDAFNGFPAQLFLTLIQALVNAQCSLKQAPLENHGPKLLSQDEFDFIVVGSGSAGSTVANRLSENPNWNVLLLEAGEEPSATSEVPALLFSMQETDESWKYETEEQEYSCQGLTNKKCKWYSGRALGGSSSINGMLYVRGTEEDYNHWEKLGNKGWSWSNVLKYFKKSEDNLDYPDNKVYHGTGGHLKVSTFNYDKPIKQIIINAANEMGIPFVKDIHNGTFIHYGNTQGTVHQGQRWSTYKAFLQTARDRPNLKIATNAYVTKVIINPETKVAEAIEVQISNKLLQVKAKREIILSAGALKSPQILLHSGIGPKKHLQEMNIKLIKELQVGENLQDHIFFLGMYVKVPEEILSPDNQTDVLYNYFMHRTGLLSTVNLISFIGTINTLNNSPYPDIQFHHAVFPKNDFYSLPLFLKVTGMSEEVTKSVLEANKKDGLLMFWPELLRPKSRGTVQLRSPSPFDSPKLISNYLKEDDDLERIYRAVRYAEKLLQTKAFEKYDTEIFQLDHPNCDKYKFRSEEYWKCSIRSLSTTVYHYCGTAKMGPSTDKEAVVDPRLKVYGIQKLRVIDTSIMPYLISANTNAAAIMIGEKGADMIKEDWASSKDEL